MRKNISLVLLVIVFFCIPARASVTIDSINTTISTCANNGSITIFATTTAGALLYAIIAGPVTLPVQTTSRFSSLPPGSYIVEVSNTANEIQTLAVTVSGNYQLPDFNPTVKEPHCPDSSSGSIIGNVSLFTGVSPYTWELIAPSPVVTLPQANDTFYHLPSGSYTIRLTDGCSNVQTKTVVLFAAPVPVNYIAGYAAITGCDTTEIAIGIQTPAYRPPYKIEYTVAGNTFIIDTARVDDESLYNGGLYIYITLPNFSYGNIVDNITITNSCGMQAFIPQLRVCTFEIINYNFIPVSTPGCRDGILTTFALGNNTCNLGLFPKFPLTVTIRDIPANNVVEVKTYRSRYDYSFASTAMLPGVSYNVTTTDSCNHSYTTTLTTPVLNRYVGLAGNRQQAMLDSTLIASIYAVGFPTQGTTLTITGGPATLHSTKPGFEYSEPYVYPKTFTGQLNSDSSTLFSMTNTAPGIYTYVITDSCGNEFPGTFEITTDMVASFNYTYTYQKGCAGSSAIQYEVVHNTSTVATITEIASGNIIHTIAGWQMNQNPFTNVVNNITAEDYEFKLLYYGNGPYMNNILVDTFVVKDTIHVTPYQNPALQTTAVSSCTGQLFLAIIADSSKGIPPYQYEIINGPQIFPPQTSHLFQLTQTGNYSIRLIDSCGNSVSTDITVNPVIFPPLNSLGSFCANDSAALTYGASAYFTYNWTRPNGTIYNGDTLFIHPVTEADTGIYLIQRVTNINGCINTETTTYRVSIGKQDSTAVSVCSGAFFQFGSRVLTQTGIYRDTISTSSCDSISIVNLTVNELKKDSIAVSICRGQGFTFGSRILAQTGIYRDTLATSTCDSVSIVNLTVNELKKDSSLVSICRDQIFPFGSRILTQTGIYRDTLSTSTCDSISIVNLTVNELKKDSSSVSICRGQLFTFGGRTLTQSGVYRDTLATTGCDSISILNLSVSDYKKDSATVAVCAGQSYSFGSNLLSQPGIYRDTLATSGCDSISILNLIVNDTPAIQIQADKYFVTAGETVQLTATPHDLTTYAWSSVNSLNSNNIYDPTSIVTTPAWYKLTVTNTNNCSNTDSLFIAFRIDSVFSCDGRTIIYIPKAFSPNGDQWNNQFRVLGLDNLVYKLYHLVIYNRWGQVIFETSKSSQAWDGTYKGTPANIGNYVYFFQLICGNGKTFTRKGNVLLLR